MLFSSSVFLFLFLPFTLIVYYVLLARRRSVQNLFLLLASLLFYAWGEPWFVLVMVLSILANYGFGLWVHHAAYAKQNIQLRCAAAVRVQVSNLCAWYCQSFGRTFCDTSH